MNKKTITLIIVFVICLGILIGCISGLSGKKNDTSESEIVASSIKYDESGKYTTSVTSDKVELSGITANDIEVRYINYENTDLQNVGNNNNELSYDELVNNLYTSTAKVDSVNKTDKGLDITFNDEKAADNKTSEYLIAFKGIKKSATVGVDFPKITLTSDIDKMYVSDDKLKATLTIEGSEFKEGISEDSISLADCFSDMSCEVISSSKNNLTVELKGNPVTNSAGAYQWGSICVKPSAIKNGYINAVAKVNIGVDYVGIDATTLALDNGKITGNLLCYESNIDVNELNKDNVKIDGINIENVEKSDKNTVKLTMSAEGIKSVNDFAELVNNKTMTVGMHEETISLSQATFYPVFDYVDMDGDRLKFTLILYGIHGNFDNSLKAEQFSFAKDFDGAKVESVKVDDNKNATLILSIPSNGRKLEEFNIEGTVTVAVGTMTNDWGEKASKECSFTRNYSNESMGRDVTLNTDTLLEIQKYTKGRDTLFGEICYWGGNIKTGVSIVQTILQMTGVLQSEHSEVMEQLHLINQKLDTVIVNQNKMMIELDKLAQTINEIGNDKYQQELSDLKGNIENVEQMLHLGAVYLALEDAVQDGKLDKVPSSSEFDKYESYLPNAEDMSDDELAAYNNRVVDYIESRSKKDYDREFDDFEDEYKELKENLKHIADRLSKSDSSNPITRFDTICSYKYNFDTQCYDFRLAERVTAQTLLSKGLAIVATREKVASNPREQTYAGLQKRVQAAMDWINDSYSKLGHPASEMKTRAFETGKFDPEYFPLCYINGFKLFQGVNARTVANDTEFQHPEIKPYFYEWPTEHIYKFIARSENHKDSLAKELNSAGFDVKGRILVYMPKKIEKYFWKDVIYITDSYWHVKGYSSKQDCLQYNYDCFYWYDGTLYK